MPEEHTDAQPEDPLHAYAEFYPEVLRAGSLRHALQAAADRAGYGLTIELMPPPRWRHIVARARSGNRSVIVSMTLGRRSFSVDCRADGARTAHGGTAELSEAAGALHSWLQGLRVPGLTAQWPFFGSGEPSGAGEPGDGVPVRWRELRAAAAGPLHAPLYELVEAAFTEPRLRALSPGTSHDWLRFSRRVTAPLSTDLPMARAIGNGRYRVRTHEGRMHETTGTSETIALILDCLPENQSPGTGPS
ncbi:DUF6193 family natural product biosynthesis protein [Streptomyces sp. MB09-01]|uniref:DUF6193 family natural product biosynthesis protein n=1 Tax=Streptomyces sp. MB09-01 TaxID=3028666 RepID=UPI0029A65382|nr:DUF6193 family natural product biosynthesis protein [Streptomyces sp. MB09-01]MDX3533034.1 DUF6193 family natural product biosynthesis protein [Streptomyces sp. MB09-01]